VTISSPHPFGVANGRSSHGLSVLTGVPGRPNALEGMKFYGGGLRMQALEASSARISPSPWKRDKVLSSDHNQLHPRGMSATAFRDRSEWTST
jgi:hypothetical protein